MYTYDAGGNITAVKTYAYTTGELGAQTGENSYSYGDDNWKDLLTGYDGQAISYDEIGNPFSYRDGMEFTWEGRRLKTASAGGKDVGYAYNSDGVRTGKTVDGVTTSYFLDGSTVVAQKTGDDVLWFLYDGDGTRVGFTYNGTAYYYTANAQGDVTGIVDKDCNTVVEYSYDAWGKLLGTTGSLADTVGKVNPFLYRGYYYDAETGLYYLNSRYYDPQTGRFLNADSSLNPGTGLNGMNLFAYCSNNPPNMADLSGHWPQWIENIASPVTNAVRKVISSVVNTVRKVTSLVVNAIKSVMPKTASSGTPNRRPNTGEPGSTYRAPNGDTRTYGPDGRPSHDYDHDDHGQPNKHPHDENGGHHHDWDWSNFPPRGNAYIISWEPVAGAALGIVCAAGVIGVAADDITGIGVADDFLLGPLFGGVGEGLIMIFG